MGIMDLPGHIVTLEIGFDELARRIDEISERVLLSIGSILPGRTSVCEFDPDFIEAGREGQGGVIHSSSAPILRGDSILEYGYPVGDLAADRDNRLVGISEGSYLVAESVLGRGPFQSSVKNRIGLSESLEGVERKM